MARHRPPRFDAKWQRRRTWPRRWRALRWWLALGGILLISAWLLDLPTRGGDWAAYQQRFVLCGERGGNAGCVIDGDTIAIGQRRIRLAGFDAPELDGECEAERALAVQARVALRDWLNAGSFLMDGGDAPPRDQYGRELRSVRRAGGGEEWLSDAMIDGGFARRSRVSGRDWCARLSRNVAQ